MNLRAQWAGVSRAKRFGIGFVFVWFFFGGLVHFVATDFDLHLMPPWVPAPRLVVYVSGVLELLGAAGLLLAATRRWAGIGLFLLTLAVTPVHFYMLQVPERFPEAPLWALWLRLPIQAALLACIGWSTWPRPVARSSAA
jgi:uncharacterized membrane protein